MQVALASGSTDCQGCGEANTNSDRTHCARCWAKVCKGEFCVVCGQVVWFRPRKKSTKKPVTVSVLNKDVYSCSACKMFWHHSCYSPRISKSRKKTCPVCLDHAFMFSHKYHTLPTKIAQAQIVQDRQRTSARRRIELRQARADLDEGRKVSEGAGKEAEVGKRPRTDAGKGDPPTPTRPPVAPALKKGRAKPVDNLVPWSSMPMVPHKEAGEERRDPDEKGPTSRSVTPPTPPHVSPNPTPPVNPPISFARVSSLSTRPAIPPAHAPLTEALDDFASTPAGVDRLAIMMATVGADMQRISTEFVQKLDEFKKTQTVLKKMCDSRTRQGINEIRYKRVRSEAIEQVNNVVDELNGMTGHIGEILKS